MADDNLVSGPDLSSGLDLSAGAGTAGAQPVAPPPSPRPFFGAMQYGRDLGAAAQNPDPYQAQENVARVQQQRATDLLRNPGLTGFLKGQGAVDDAQKMLQQSQQTLRDVAQRKQSMSNSRQAAYAAGMNPDVANGLQLTGDEKQDHTTILNGWTRQLDTGSFTAFKALQGMGPEGANAIAQQEGTYMPALSARNDEAANIIERLNTAASMPQALGKTGKTPYQATLDELGGPAAVGKALSNYAPGFAVPNNADAWNVRAKGVNGALQMAKQVVSQYDQHQAQLGQSTPIKDKDEAAAQLNSNFRGTYGDAVPGASATTMPWGEVGAKLAPGSSDPQANYGGGRGQYNNESAEGRAAFNTSLGSEQAKGAIADYKLVKKVQALAQDDKTYQSAAGIAMLTGEIGAVERDLAEGSRAAGTPGLSKMLEQKYGLVGSALNTAYKEVSEVNAWLKGGSEGAMPRLSPTTINGIKHSVDFKYQQARNELSERLGQPLSVAGYQGMNLAHTGLDAELQKDPALLGMYEQGRQAYVQDVMKRPFVLEGTSRIMLREDSKYPQRKLTTYTAPASQDATQPNASSPSPPDAQRGAPAPSSPPSAGPPSSGGGTNPPHPVDHAMQGVATAVQAAGLPASTVQQVASNPRVEKELNEKGQISAQTVASAIGRGNDKGLLSKLKGVLDYWYGGTQHPEGTNNNPTGPQPPLAAPEPQAGSFATGRTDIPGGETDAGQKAVENAPTLGATAGTMLGGPVGGAAFAGAGRAFQDWAQGREVKPTAILGSAAMGASGGMANAPARIATAAAGGAIEGAGEEGSVKGALKGAAISGGFALGGETMAAIGHGLGMVGRKIWSRFTDDAKSAIAEDMAVVARGKPEKPGTLPGGAKNTAAESAYEKDLAAYEKAESALKEALPGIKPDEAADAYTAATQGGKIEPGNRGEVVSQRAARKEATDVGREYQDLHQDVADTGVGKPKTTAIPNGPSSLVQSQANPTGAVPPKYAADMASAEQLASAPAQTVGEHWNNVFKARSRLLDLERDALDSTAADAGTRAKAMRAGADSLRDYQKKIAEHVFGPEDGKAVIARLQQLDVRYARAMKVLGTGNVAETIAKGDEKGREMAAAFKAVAHNDPQALQLVNRMVNWKKTNPTAEVGLMVPVIAGELGLGHAGVVSGPLAVWRLGRIFQGYMAERAAGRPVQLKDFVKGAKAQAIWNPATLATNAAVQQK